MADYQYGSQISSKSIMKYPEYRCKDSRYYASD